MKFKENQFCLDYYWLKGKKKEFCIALSWKMYEVNTERLNISESFKFYRKNWSKRTIYSLIKDGYIQLLEQDDYYYYILPAEKYII